MEEQTPRPKIKASDILDEYDMIVKQMATESPHLSSIDIDKIVIHTMKTKYSQYDF